MRLANVPTLILHCRGIDDNTLIKAQESSQAERASAASRRQGGTGILLATTLCSVGWSEEGRRQRAVVGDVAVSASSAMVMCSAQAVGFCSLDNLFQGSYINSGRSVGT